MALFKLQFASGLAGIALLLSLQGLPLRAQTGGPKPNDSQEARAQADSANITKLLADAKWHAALAEYDADTLVTYTYGNVPWQAHASELRMIAEHVNNLGKVVKELNDARGQASPWQAVAIDRINPLLNNMATHLNSTIQALNEHQERVNMPEFRDYLHTNADLASRTSSTVSDFVEYSRAGQQVESLQQKLELPPKS